MLHNFSSLSFVFILRENGNIVNSFHELASNNNIDFLNVALIYFPGNF